LAYISLGNIVICLIYNVCFEVYCLKIKLIFLLLKVTKKYVNLNVFQLPSKSLFMCFVLFRVVLCSFVLFYPLIEPISYVNTIRYDLYKIRPCNVCFFFFLIPFLLLGKTLATTNVLVFKRTDLYLYENQFSSSVSF
jgi:hypothetical protein